MITAVLTEEITEVAAPSPAPSPPQRWRGAQGRVTQFTDRKGQVSTFTYDALNRRVSSAFADGSTTTFVYDAVGRLVSAADSVAGLITFVHDTLDRLDRLDLDPLRRRLQPPRPPCGDKHARIEGTFPASCRRRPFVTTMLHVVTSGKRHGDLCS